MKPAFHVSGVVDAQPARTLFDAVGEAGETQAMGSIDILDMVNDIACARVVMEDWHGITLYTRQGVTLLSEA